MTVSRRSFVATAAVGVGIGLAGCFGENKIQLSGEDVLPVPVAGDPDADVTVAVFEDFGCGACRQYKLNLYPQIKQQYIDPGEIRYEHRDFPNPTDPEWSYPVASAARSVQDQAGDEAFFAFASAIYEEQNSYSLDVIEATAANLNADLDPAQVRADADEDAYHDDIEAERERAANAGVDGTPTVLVDQVHVETSSQAIGEAIEDAL